MPLRTRTSDIIDDFLLGIAVSGVIATTVAAPNSLEALEKPLIMLLNGRDKRHEARRIGRYLKQQKIVQVIDNDDDSFTVTLSQKG